MVWGSGTGALLCRGSFLLWNKSFLLHCLKKFIWGAAVLLVSQTFFGAGTHRMEGAFTLHMFCGNKGCLFVKDEATPCRTACVSGYLLTNSLVRAETQCFLSPLNLECTCQFLQLFSLCSLHRFKCMDEIWICGSWPLSLQQTFLSQLTRSALLGWRALFICPAGWLPPYYIEKSNIQTWHCGIPPTCTAGGVCGKAWRYFSPMV